MRFVPIAIASVATLAAAGVAANVSGPQAAQIMHERHEGMENIGNAFKALHREFDGSSAVVPTIRASADQLAILSKKASGWFPIGTGPEVGKTGARPEIWQNPQDFA